MATVKKAKKPARKVNAGRSSKTAEERKRIFIEAYLSNGMNATEAALTAGYSRGGAAKQGYRMSNDPSILSMLRKRQDELAEKHCLTTDAVLKDLSSIVHIDPRELCRDDGTFRSPLEWSDRLAAAVSSFEVGDNGELKKVKLWDKNAAIDKAMKHLGLFERDNAQNKPLVHQSYTISFK